MPQMIKTYFPDFCKKGGSIDAQCNLPPLAWKHLHLKEHNNRNRYPCLAMNVVRYFRKIEHGHPIPRLYMAARKNWKNLSYHLSSSTVQREIFRIKMRYRITCEPRIIQYMLRFYQTELSAGLTRIMVLKVTNAKLLESALLMGSNI